MKPKTTLSVLLSLFLLTNCNSKTNQPKETSLWNDTVTQIQTQDKIVADNGDTTVYQNPHIHPQTEDLTIYFKQNNKFKNWDKNDKKNVRIYGIVEKNGKFSVETIKGDAPQELIDEAVRLVKGIKINPAKDEYGNTVRSNWFFGVDFPPE